MEDERTKQIKKYLKLKKLQEEDKSDDLIEEISREIMNNYDNIG